MRQLQDPCECCSHISCFLRQPTNMTWTMSWLTVTHTHTPSHSHTLVSRWDNWSARHLRPVRKVFAFLVGLSREHRHLPAQSHRCLFLICSSSHLHINCFFIFFILHELNPTSSLFFVSRRHIQHCNAGANKFRSVLFCFVLLYWGTYTSK